MSNKAKITGRPGKSPRWNRDVSVGYNSLKIHKEGLYSRVPGNIYPQVETLFKIHLELVRKVARWNTAM
jgi:hypothetical protein